MELTTTPASRLWSSRTQTKRLRGGSSTASAFRHRAAGVTREWQHLGNRRREVLVPVAEEVSELVQAPKDGRHGKAPMQRFVGLSGGLVNVRGRWAARLRDRG